jgi:hypothetical protein
MKAKREPCSVAAVAMVFTIAVLVATVVAARPDGMPNNPDAQGEFCWVAGPAGSQLDEYSLVIAQITNMGNGHLLYHGKTYRVQSNIDLTRIGSLQAFNGSAERDGSAVIGQLTKAEILERDDPDPDLIESYVGYLWFDLGTLEGFTEGIISTCPVGGLLPCDDQINTGPIPLMPVACP